MRSYPSASKAVRGPTERNGTFNELDSPCDYGWIRKWVTLVVIAAPQLLRGDTITGFDSSRWSLFSGYYQPGSGNVPAYSGLALLDTNTLQLNASSSPTLNTGDCVSAAWYNTKVAVNSFQATFTWEVTGADFSSGFGPADGFTFVFQNQGLDANGGFGGGLGYFTYGTPGITTSAGLEFRVYRAGTGYVENAGLVTYGGDLGDGAAVSLDALNHPIDITITYDGTTLTETLKDQITGGTFSTSYSANIPAAVGNSTAFVGFTSGTGNGTMDDFITNFRFDSPGIVPPPPPPPLPEATAPTATLPVPAGGNATLTESATGVAPLTYQWYQGNGGDTSQPVGTNGPTLTSPALLGSTSYWVRVTDGNGQSADSPALLVTVVPIGLGLGNTVACAGSDVSIPFIATGFAGIGSFQTSIQWDPGVVTYTGFDASAIPGLGADDVFGDPAHGVAIIAWEDATIAGATVPDGSTLFSLHFHLSGTPGTSTPVVVTNSPTPLEVTDADGNVLSAALSAGQIQILGALNLTGSVAYYRASAPVPGVTLQLGGGSSSSTLSGADGLFSIPVPSCADLTLTPELNADAPLTKGITMLDVQAVRSHIQGQTKLTSPFALLAADVNGSRTITAADLRQIRLFILQLRTNFPVAGGSLWRFVPSDYVFPDPLSPWDAPGTRFMTGLQAAPAGQNFQAVKLGDVDGSWDPAPLSPNRPLTVLDAPAGPVRLSATEQLVNAGDSVEIAVKASQVDRLTTAQFTLTWDPSVLKFTGTSGYNLTGMDSESFGTSWADRGRLNVGWDDPTLHGVMVSEGQTLFVAQFKVMGGQGSSSTIQISGNPTPIELSSSRKIIPTTTAPGLVAVRAVTPGTLWATIGTEDKLQLSYESPQGTSWEVEASSDLIHWTLVGAGIVDAKNSLATVALPLRTNQRQFYRAVQVY
jgi:Cohesin domain/Ig-like domain CHU_C associated